MKAIKKIVGASCALVMAVAISTGASFAWLGAARTTVTVDGMNVNIDVPESLAVSGSLAGLSDKAGNATLSVPSRWKLSPATYVASDTSTPYYQSASNPLDIAAEAHSYGNLIYVTNPENIDEDGGPKTEGSNQLPLYYAFANDGSAAGKLHYLEVGVYIATTAANPIESKSIQVKMTAIDKTTHNELLLTSVPDIYECLTVDFYTKSVSAEVVADDSNTNAAFKYKTPSDSDYEAVKTITTSGLSKLGIKSNTTKRSGTINLQNGSTAATIYDGSITGNTIPTQSSGNAICVWMRIYFDGAMIAACNNGELGSVSTDGVSFKLSFSLVNI